VSVTTNTKVGVTSESVAGIPFAKVQVTLVWPSDETPVPVTPSILQLMESAVSTKLTPVNSKVVESTFVMVATVGEVASRASNWH
jgi:hypothetical protein